MIQPLLQHRKIDGTGYPNVKINTIPIYVQLVSVADILSAISMNRCYHEKKDINDTVQIVLSEMNKEFSENILELIRDHNFQKQTSFRHS